MLLGAPGLFDGPAYEPRRHGVQLACVVFPGRLRRAWRRHRSATALDRDDRRLTNAGRKERWNSGHMSAGLSL
jgi:hypothetical protein